MCLAVPNRQRNSDSVCLGTRPSTVGDGGNVGFHVSDPDTTGPVVGDWYTRTTRDFSSSLYNSTRHTFYM